MISLFRQNRPFAMRAQLIDAHSDQHLWADSYDRSLREILSTEHEVSSSIAETVELKLSPELKAYLAAAHPIDPEAHDDYLKGRFFWSQRTEPDLKKAVECFQQAIARQPNYAAAYAGLADKRISTWDLSSGTRLRMMRCH